jgi:hypothetical protein
MKSVVRGLLQAMTSAQLAKKSLALTWHAHCVRKVSVRILSCTSYIQFKSSSMSISLISVSYYPIVYEYLVRRRIGICPSRFPIAPSNEFPTKLLNIQRIIQYIPLAAFSSVRNFTKVTNGKRRKICVFHTHLMAAPILKMLNTLYHWRWMTGLVYIIY